MSCKEYGTVYRNPNSNLGIHHSQKFGFVPTGGMVPFSKDIASTSPTCIQDYLALHNHFSANSRHNCSGNRILIPNSTFNIQAWEGYLKNYSDCQILDLIKYGFPLDIVPNYILGESSHDNHPTANQYPEDIDSYLETEIKHGAILGPFEYKPIKDLHCSPMLTRPKPNSTNRRVIVDLSWPENLSVNANVESDVYLGTEFKLKFPTIDDIVQRIIDMKGNCLLFKVDLERAFRILKLDPKDIKHVGLKWNGKYYVDTAVPFGYRHGSVCCQRLTDAIRFIVNNHGYYVFNYIDDFIGLDQPAIVFKSYKFLVTLLAELGIPISKNKLYPPAEEVPCLGILINVIQGTLRIPDDKLATINNICLAWAKKSKATRTQLQSLAGSLLYIHKCVKPARLFTNRVLATLRGSPEKGQVKLTDEFQKDIAWFNKFLTQFNGSSFFHKQLNEEVQNMYLDACLVGMGGVWGTEVYQCAVPYLSAYPNASIVHLEMLNVLVALRLWTTALANKCLKIYCDNIAVVSVITTGKGVDPLLLSIARNIWLVAAANDINISVVHIMGKHNHVADLLSRWLIYGNPNHLLKKYICKPIWKVIDSNMFLIDINI